MKELLKKHSDVFTVAAELYKMQDEYKSQGYDCEVFYNFLRIDFSDGFALISWQDGGFYQECFKYDIDGKPVAI